MTVQATVRKVGPTPGNSLATVFPFAFKVFAKTDIQVTLQVISTGAESVLVLDDPLGYSVALNVDQNANPGGSVTYNPAGIPMPATLALTISSIVPEVQGTHIINGGAFFANNVEDAVDKAVINVQDLALKVNQSLQVPISDPSPAKLPAVVSRANRVLGFDANGDPIALAANITVYGVRQSASVAVAAQRLVNLGFFYTPGVNALGVYVDGIRAQQGVDYTESSTSSITFLYDLVAGQRVVVFGGQEVTATGGTFASLCTYVLAGVGAIWRSVMDWIRDQPINVKDYGAVGDGVTNDSAAIQRAIAACIAQGGGRVYHPRGRYRLVAGLVVAANDVQLEGEAMQATEYVFDPAIAGAAVTFANGAQSVWFCGIKRFYFSSPDHALQKQMVKVVDARQFVAEEIGNNDGTWDGATSIGIDVYGREFIRIKKCYIYADQPVRYNLNPNLATNSLDHSSIEQTNLVVTNALARHNVQFNGAHIVTRFVARDLSTVRGAGAILMDATGASPSIGIQIIGGRHEQGVVGVTYTHQFTGTVGEIQGLQIEDWDYSGQVNGVRLGRVRNFNLRRLILGRPAGTAIKFDANCVGGHLDTIYYEAGSTIDGSGTVQGLKLTAVANGSALQVLERNLVLVNGNNNEVPMPVGGEVLTVTGPTGAFSITGLQQRDGGNTSGRTIKIVNNTAFNMTIAHDNVNSAVGTRIKVGGSADLVISANGAVDLVFINASSYWYVTGQKA